MFVAVPSIVWNGHRYKVDQEFKWKEMGVSQTKVTAMWQAGHLKHDPELEKKAYIGDGLELLTKPQLNELVDRLNNLATHKYPNKNMKCKKANSKNQQIGLIRQFRRVSPDDLEE